MANTFNIDLDTIYDDGALVLALGITHATLTRARRSGTLRFTRKGKQVLYRGQWIINWIEKDEPQEGADDE